VLLISIEFVASGLYYQKITTNIWQNQVGLLLEQQKEGGNSR